MEIQEIDALDPEEFRDRLHQARIKPNTHWSCESKFPYGLFTDSPRQAAILVPLLRRENKWHVLYTQRNANLPEHSGQVAFPGGRIEEGDRSLEETALREAYEEINLLPQDVNILGQLHELHTISNYCVTPFVGVIPWPYPFKLEVEEVSLIFTLPLTWLADPQNHEERWRELPQPYDPVPVIYFHSYAGELLWGVSADITLFLIDALQLNK